MTQLTEPATVALRKATGISKHCYRLPYSQTNFVRTFRIWSPQATGEEITVLSIQRGEASNGHNLLARPVQLVYLNNVLQWFDWLLPERTEGLVLGIDRELPLMLDVEQEPPTDWSAHHADQAYHSWINDNPDGDYQQWFSYLLNRFHCGSVTCRFSNCEEPLVPGTRQCKEHQGM